MMINYDAKRGNKNKSKEQEQEGLQVERLWTFETLCVSLKFFHAFNLELSNFVTHKCNSQLFQTQMNCLF